MLVDDDRFRHGRLDADEGTDTGREPKDGRHASQDLADPELPSMPCCRHTSP